jgi:hypothetical protein
MKIVFYTWKCYCTHKNALHTWKCYCIHIKCIARIKMHCTHQNAIVYIWKSIVHVKIHCIHLKMYCTHKNAIVYIWKCIVPVKMHCTHQHKRGLWRQQIGQAPLRVSNKESRQTLSRLHKGVRVSDLLTVLSATPNATVATERLKTSLGEVDIQWRCGEVTEEANRLGKGRTGVRRCEREDWKHWKH